MKKIKTSRSNQISRRSKQKMKTRRPKSSYFLRFMWRYNAPKTTKLPTFGMEKSKCPRSISTCCKSVAITSSCSNKHNSKNTPLNGTKSRLLSIKSSHKVSPSANALTCLNCFIFTLSLGFTQILTPKSMRSVSKTSSQTRWFLPTGWRIEIICLFTFCLSIKSWSPRRASWWWEKSSILKSSEWLSRKYCKKIYREIDGGNASTGNVLLSSVNGTTETTHTEKGTSDSFY